MPEIEAKKEDSQTVFAKDPDAGIVWEVILLEKKPPMSLIDPTGDVVWNEDLMAQLVEALAIYSLYMSGMVMPVYLHRRILEDILGEGFQILQETQTLTQDIFFCFVEISSF